MTSGDRFSPFRRPSCLPSTVLMAAIGLFLALFLPGQVKGQTASIGTGCDVPHFDRFANIALSNGSRITYFTTPTIVCSEGTRITADSAVVYEATNYTQLFGNVVFSDPDSRLTASEAHYFDQERRLRAWGRVVLHDLIEGSIIRGDTMVLLRAGAGRLEDQITVLGQRPTATLFPTMQPIPVDTAFVPEPDGPGLVAGDSTGASDPEAEPEAPAPVREVFPTPPPPAEKIPYEIEARRIFIEGSRYFRATGSVTIHRDSVDAVADSVEYDGSAGALFLAHESRLTTSDFDLSAETIRLGIPQGEIKDVLARHQSVLEGEDLRLLAPTISLFLVDGQLERLVAQRDSLLDELPEEALLALPPHPAAEAVGLRTFPITPHAFAEDFMLRGDSIEVLAPGGVLEEVWAMGNARGESLAGDSLNTDETPEIALRDWIEADTVIAVFKPTAQDTDLEVEDPEAELVLPPSRVQAAEGTEAQSDSSGFTLDRLIARVGARSLYRMAASDSTEAQASTQTDRPTDGQIEVQAEGPPGGPERDRRQAIHYVVGDEITIFMVEGEVDRMEVKGATRGIHLEPVGRTERGGLAQGQTALPEAPNIPPDTTATPGRRGGGGR